MGYFCMVSCGYPELKRKLSEKDIVGTWRLTQQTLGEIARKAASTGTRVPSTKDPKNYTLILSQDHTCTFRSLLESLNVVYVKSTGQWSLLHDGDPFVERGTANVLKLDLNGTSWLSPFEYHFTKREGRVMICTFMEDPQLTERDVLEYERVAQ
jgi:hypothetical protein